ncbi:GNAT family N-acetyltransferase [Brachybacterium sp. EF45031]|uniref:GNAT family N-acetyltransferase n=1 Tax=Brachybacterium sillae TaxID=2810536 RepID=UPI00217E7940|nr:GNAT family N-acetyltransferase [Brachybacterium sillae]MCS6710537.1 GNAT family N-acetyltransferase [Brachybacterium sillae]
MIRGDEGAIRSAVVLSSLGTWSEHPGPPGATARWALEQGATPEDWMFGPAAVSRAHQGQGLYRHLVEAVTAEARAADRRMVAFIDCRNQRSRAVHRALGLTEGDILEVGDQQLGMLRMA